MTPQISEQLMNNGSRELALKLAAVSTPEDMADRIVKLEAGFATIMQAYDDPGGDLRHTVAAAIWALFPPRNTTQP
jgi:hypothetical protein